MTGPLRRQTIRLAEGAGGGAMRELIEGVFLRGAAESPRGGVGLRELDDGAAIPVGDRWLVVTTDTHVIHPIFFPGGDIGRLAVAGTVNDLAMMGATTALGLTCAVVLEEGFPRADLERVHASLVATSAEAGAPIVTGDTKVMGRGEVDGLIVNTTGVALTARLVTDAGLRPGDAVIVTGSMGDHGLAIMAHRHELDLEGDLRSDVAPIADLVARAMEAGGDAITAMKDPTRGGLASVLNEMAAKGGVGVLLEEARVPLTDEVRAASELLGIDPLHVANEGKAVLGVRPDVADAVLEAIRSHPLGARAAVVGRCIDEHHGRVILDTGFGRRLLTEPEGEPLPRIC
ncbi:MAG: hydrogenase expression/formation protein HypE [Myxococcota bacterium]